MISEGEGAGHTCQEGEAGRHRNIQAGRQAGRQTGRQADRQADRQAVRPHDYLRKASRALRE